MSAIAEIFLLKTHFICYFRCDYCKKNYLLAWVLVLFERALKYNRSCSWKQAV